MKYVNLSKVFCCGHYRIELVKWIVRQKSLPRAYILVSKFWQFSYSSRIICIRALVFKVSNSGLKIIMNTCVFISKVFVFLSRDFCVTGFNGSVIALFPNQRIYRTHVSIFNEMNNRFSSFAIIRIHDSPFKCLYCLPYRTLNHSGQ